MVLWCCCALSSLAKRLQHKQVHDFTLMVVELPEGLFTPVNLEPKIQLIFERLSGSHVGLWSARHNRYPG